MNLMQIFLAYKHSLPFPQFCKKLAYPVETHLIPTADGLNLTYFRLQKKNSNLTSGLPVVLMHHGLVDSADTWIVNQQNKAPALVLANEGYDVWVGNSRGNKYNSIKQHWNFSYMHMAELDLPAAFSYISSHTSQKVNYVGHSQGTTIMFAALSLNLTQVRSNIGKFIALGPVTYITNQRSVLFKHPLTKLLNILQQVKVQKMLMPFKGQQIFSAQTCKISPQICLKIIQTISDDDPNQLNKKALPDIVGHFPAGTSLMNLMHWNQMVLKSQFKKYDYGVQENLKKYGQKQPPRYRLQDIDIPVHMFVGSQDKLADSKDADRLFNQLTASKDRTIKILRLGHAGFIWNQDMSWFNEVIELLKI